MFVLSSKRKLDYGNTGVSVSRVHIVQVSVKIPFFRTRNNTNAAVVRTPEVEVTVV